MKFNIYFTISGPCGVVVSSNTTNPVEVESFKILLEELAANLPSPFGCKCIGLRIEEIIP